MNLFNKHNCTLALTYTHPAYTYTHIYTYINTYIHTYIHALIHTYIHIHIRMYTCFYLKISEANNMVFQEEALFTFLDNEATC